MRKIIIVTFLFVSIICFSQQGESISVKNEIEINVDKSIFILQQGDSYFTEDQKSSFKAMLIPMKYDVMKSNMEKKDDKFFDKGEVIIDGVNILFAKELSDDKQNIILIYCKKNDEKTSLSFISFYPKEKENYYKPIIEKAFLSTKIKI